MDVRGLLLDLDGVLYEGDHAVPGAVAAVAALREAGFPLRFVTNTTLRSRRGVAAYLADLGFTVDVDELVTAPAAASSWLRVNGIDRIALLLPDATREDFAQFTVDERRPQAVIVGDLGAAWNFDRLNAAFRWLLAGARLVAIQKNRYWRSGASLVLDAGPFVAALEYAADTKATLVGKPSPAFYEAAASAMDLPLDAVAMVGDDVRSDVNGAQAAGCSGVLVRTGKYRDGDESRTERAPDAVIDSIAALPQLLGSEEDGGL